MTLTVGQPTPIQHNTGSSPDNTDAQSQKTGSDGVHSIRTDHKADSTFKQNDSCRPNSGDSYFRDAVILTTTTAVVFLNNAQETASEKLTNLTENLNETLANASSTAIDLGKQVVTYAVETVTEMAIDNSSIGEPKTGGGLIGQDHEDSDGLSGRAIFGIVAGVAVTGAAIGYGIYKGYQHITSNNQQTQGTPQQSPESGEASEVKAEEMKPMLSDTASGSGGDVEKNDKAEPSEKKTNTIRYP